MVNIRHVVKSTCSNAVWRSSCMGNEAGVPEFRARSNVNFCERARLPLAHSMPVTHGDSGIPAAESPLKPRSQRPPRLRLQLASRDFAFLCLLARTKTHSCRRKCRFCTRNRCPPCHTGEGENVLTDSPRFVTPRQLQSFASMFFGLETKGGKRTYPRRRLGNLAEENVSEVV